MRLWSAEIIKARPFLSSAVFFALGISAAYYWQKTSFLDLLIFILLSGGLFALLAIFFRERKLVFICFLIFLAGFLRMGWQEYKYYSPYSIANYNSAGSLIVQGIIREDLSSLEGNKLILKSLYVENRPVKYGYIQLDKRYLPLPLQNGEVVEIKLNLNEPARALNPGGFSNYDYLKRKGIYSQGYYAGEIQLRGRVRNFFLDTMVDLKYHLLALLDRTGEEPYNELLKALLLGERSGLPEEWEASFTNAGTNHLLSISGLHVGFVVGIFYYFLNLFRLPRGPGNLFLSLLVMIYIILTGFRPSIFRAGLLAVFLLWGQYFQRRGDYLNILGLTALLNFLINPYQLFDIGFQLSYFVLLTLILWRDLMKEKLGLAFSVSAAALLGSSPLTAYYFNILTPIGLITNLWAVPLAGFIVSLALVGLLAGLLHPVFSALIFKLLVYPIKFLVYSNGIMALIPFGHLEVATPPVVILVFCIIIIILLPFLLKKRIIAFNERKRRRRLFALSLICLLFIFFSFFISVLDRDLEISFISVGQGDSIFLRTPGKKALLIDGGGFLGEDASHGEYTVLPYLKYRGIRKLDIVFISHFDADHALGIVDILKNRKVNLLVLPLNYDKNEIAERVLDEARKNNVPVVLAQQGDYFLLDGVILRVLNPVPGFKGSRNDNSLVIKVEYGNFSALLTGDLEAGGESRLLAGGQSLKSTILKLGHHGSNSSSTEAFLYSVAPEEGIISVGRNNYGHPAAEVLSRCASQGIKIWRTDQQGAIRVRTNGLVYTIEGYLK